MNRLLGSISTIIVIASILLFIFVYSVLSPVDKNNTIPIEIEIKQGQSSRQVIAILRQNNLIRSSAAARYYLIASGQGKNIKAGFVYLSPSLSTPEIITSLTKALDKQVRVVVPEGLRHEEVANLFLDQFHKQNPQNNFDVDLFIQKSSTLEGKLFPDTYNFSYATSTEEVISALLSRYEQIISSSKIAPITQKELIIASLLERESRGNLAEKKEIAGIIANRLANNWPLQIDATVQFALASSRCRFRQCVWWPNSLTSADLKIISPYNTYINQGLPPGPIGNPGKDSLIAAKNPAITSNWFYLHDNQGVVHYAQTVEQHNRNICTYLRKSC